MWKAKRLEYYFFFKLKKRLSLTKINLFCAPFPKYLRI